MDSLFGGMAMIVRVIKADGSVEEYLHTKTLLCISTALSDAQEWDTATAQNLAEVVTTFIYCQREEQIASESILAMIELVLVETGYSNAAAALSEHHRRRTLARNRTEVVVAEVRKLSDAEAVAAGAMASRQWSKSRVAEHIQRTYGLQRQPARAAAARTEEKVLAIGMTRVWSGLVRQIALAETAAMLRAEECLCDACCQKHLAVSKATLEPDTVGV
jgi:hypothetical protein